MRINVPIPTAALEAKVDVIDGYHDVPTADVATNAQIRDVVGNKADGADSTIGTSQSLVANLKGVIFRITAAAGNITGTDWARDVVGNKADTAQTTVGTTRSIVAYVKGILNALATHDTALGTHDTALGVVDGNVDNLEAERLQRVVAEAATGNSTADSWADILNITDKGVLTGIYVRVTADTGQLKVIIDGVTVLDNSGDTYAVAGDPTVLSWNHRFDTSLQVQVQNDDNTTPVRCTVTYTID